MEIWTIGYEKAALADVLGALKAAGIQLLADVRDLPQSRRAGFSKRMLSASLAEVGIDYLHMKPLGTPPEGREAHRSGDEARFRRIVDTQLATEAAGEALTELAGLAAARRVCLLCYEADWHRCHRARIAELLADRHGCTATHLEAAPHFI